MRVMSDSREAMWGVVQVVLSDLDFDFQDYAARHFTRMQQSIGQPWFEEALDAASASASGPRARGHHRRWGRRDRHRLPPGQARREGRGPARPRRADQRLHLPLRRAGGPAEVVGLPDHDDDAQRRPIPAAARGVRVRPGLERGPARCDWPRRARGWRSCAARRRGPGRSACRWSWSPPRRRSGCSPDEHRRRAGAAYNPTTGTGPFRS